MNRIGQSASILIVDDTPANLQVLAAMLRRRGYKARPVTSGVVALSAARSDPPDLVLLDISMPDMSGYELSEHFKADAVLKGIPIIFISGLTEELDKVKAFASGGVDYLTKPFQMEELHARVETHLKLRRAQIELEQYSRNLEAARERLKMDLEWAGAVQRGLLPQRLPEIPGYEMSALYQPVFEVGGDYYDVIPLPRERVAVLVGDVAGKGVAAALLMAKLSADVRFCMLTEPTPAAAFHTLNTLTNHPGLEGRFVTLLAAVLDPADHSVTLVNAGHPPPLIYHRATQIIDEAVSIEAANLPLGVFEKVDYPSSHFTLEPGDSVLAFTDGVTEAMNSQNHQLRVEGLCEALQGKPFSPRDLVSHVSRTLNAFTAGQDQHDDITLVGFGRLL